MNMAKWASRKTMRLVSAPRSVHNVILLYFGIRVELLAEFVFSWAVRGREGERG